MQTHQPWLVWHTLGLLLQHWCWFTPGPPERHDRVAAPGATFLWVSLRKSCPLLVLDVLFVCALAEGHVLHPRKIYRLQENMYFSSYPPIWNRRGTQHLVHPSLSGSNLQPGLQCLLPPWQMPGKVTQHSLKEPRLEEQARSRLATGLRNGNHVSLCRDAWMWGRFI